MAAYRMAKMSVFTNLTFNRLLISKLYKELKKLDINKPNNLTKIGYRSK